MTVDAVRIVLWSVCAGVAVATVPARLSGQDRWAQADAAVVRLAPSAFENVPIQIRRDLERRGCRVPQADVGARVERHNVVSGDFTGNEQIAWAVLCSIRDSSRVLVYPSDLENPSDSLASSADAGWLQGVEAGRIAFSRRILAAPAPAIQARLRMADSAAAFPAIEHAGIEDIFVGKASVIYYRSPRGAWLRLPGA